MNFRTIKASLITILGNAAAGRYRTIGYQRQAQTAEENLDTSRSVQVFYQSGDFPESAAAMSGPVMHGITFAVQMTVATAAKADLTVIDNPGSTEQDLADAINAMQNAQQLADDSMDELIEILYQELMDNENIDIGLDTGIVTSRWVGDVQKNKPLERGEYIVLTGSIKFTCKTDEQLVGDAGSTAGQVIDQEINFEDQNGNQDPAKTGVSTW